MFHHLALGIGDTCLRAILKMSHLLYVVHLVSIDPIDLQVLMAFAFQFFLKQG